MALMISTPKALASEKNYGIATVSEVTSIYDADTFRVSINGWPPIIGERISIRANGFDAPEIRGKCESEKIAARQAKQLTVELLRGAKVIELRNMKRGKYFRIVADVYLDGKPLADIQIRSGLSRPYSGGKRLSWCE
ncbi:thermonuclease family protein [Ferrimonas lipolytica]|uniref:Thermonuclease family protein n=2 Tax=Ferrimonas lipolytica TaxID=2724191 RepID=A0A6H1UHF5_9GAMM|nr:thermonuclease family protein [Ferrimonas lipolytica]